jgi:hypothetical protein
MFPWKVMQVWLYLTLQCTYTFYGYGLDIQVVAWYMYLAVSDLDFIMFVCRMASLDKIVLIIVMNWYSDYTFV